MRRVGNLPVRDLSTFLVTKRAVINSLAEVGTPARGVSAGARKGAAAAEPPAPAALRYEGFDSFRGVAAFGVILLHFHFMRDTGEPLAWLMRLRDCALPFLVLCSFFLLARAAWAKPKKEFRRFAYLRFKYIGLPFYTWTLIYYVVWDAIRPLTKGAAITRPDAALLIGGYVHLWYLQVLFFGSLMLYPLLCLASRLKRWQTGGAFLAGGLCHAVWLEPALREKINAVWLESHSKLHTLIAGANTCLTYILLAVVIALYAEKITRAYKYRAVRVASLGVVLAAALAHATAGTEFFRVVYSVSLFLALLQPVPAGLVRLLRPLSKYSYPIYILHFGIAYAVSGAFSRAHVATSAASVLAGSVVIYGVSLLCAVLIRAVFPNDWFLPVVSVEPRAAAVKPRRSLETTPAPAPVT